MCLHLQMAPEIWLSGGQVGSWAIMPPSYKVIQTPWGLGVRRPEFQPHTCSQGSVCPWTNPSTSVDLSFLICQVMEVERQTLKVPFSCNSLRWLLMYNLTPQKVEDRLQKESKSGFWGQEEGYEPRTHQRETKVKGSDSTIFYLQSLGIPMSLKNAKLLSCFGGTQCRGLKMVPWRWVMRWWGSKWKALQFHH